MQIPNCFHATDTRAHPNHDFLLLILLIVMSSISVGCSSSDPVATNEAVSATLVKAEQAAAPQSTYAPSPISEQVTSEIAARSNQNPVALTACDISPIEVLLFVAETVPTREQRIIEEAICLSKQLYFDKDATNWQMATPVYVAALNRYDPESAIKLESEYCEFIQHRHPEAWMCDPDNSNPNCETDGLCLFTEEDGRVSGSSISSSRHRDEFYLFINQSHDDDASYWYVALHEMFHIYQISSIADPDISGEGLARFLGLRSASNRELDSPWWMEGTAVYMSHYYYSAEKEATWEHLRREMGRYLNTDYNGSGLGTILEQYKGSGKHLADFNYGGSDHQVAYGMGAWFVAYLVNLSGIDKIFEFYSILEESGGFEDAFVATYGRSHNSYLTEFDLFLDKSKSEIMSILPE
ncbi:hypothetical protein [Candidatus Lucifugimonas marina]|uniref:Uncharacterized protein n=1 Tax=Candidatus Lucifugimonas marina TaxID=3038979 RepID=A0AAJ5ZEG7_9CHLR|nr:hypothetical protein [SAR202 cluster bacterium JH702]MDG0870970.1 hypothetical protein [SAR202 cluster bacterium JH639]WFG34727.1 hypothetical protein GKN94_03200 [SAR202 cluster bacterium JH545]WFG38654.1 hypothetical protein GKO48_03205 [SAR202 cluster bacterium JH1073]